MGDGHPEYGQLVIINFTANWNRLRLCYFDNYDSWVARNPNEDFGRDDLGEAYIGGWFSEADDPTDWWQRQFVSHWAPIAALPQQDKVSGDQQP